MFKIWYKYVVFVTLLFVFLYYSFHITARIMTKQKPEDCLCMKLKVA